MSGKRRASVRSSRVRRRPEGRTGESGRDAARRAARGDGDRARLRRRRRTVHARRARHRVGTQPPRLIAPDVAPFTVVRSEMERTVQSSGWMRRPWVDIEYRYVMRAHRAGTHTVPPFTAELNGERARSRSVTIAVSNAVPVASVPEIVARAPLDPRLPVNFRALVLPETVYVGEQATYQVAMFVDADVRGNLRRNPDFFAPEMRSLMAYELPLGPLASAPNRRIGHRRYEAHVYQRALFPITTG